MKKLYFWYNNLSKRVRDSILASITTIGLISTVLSIIGISLGDWNGSSVVIRIAVVVGLFLAVFGVSYYIIGRVFRDSVKTIIRKTQVSIGCGDIFDTSGMRVIGCDTHFDTRVDDVVISKNSLHGQLVLKHGVKEEIEQIVDVEAKKLKLKKNKDGLYDFPLGTIIRYDSSVDGHTYLMLAMTKLNSQHEAHTNMADFETMLMKMWKEINRVYARNDIVLPILGTGISRFDDGPKEPEDLLRCMLCTLNSSGVTLKSNVEIIIYGDAKEIPLYEYRNLFNVIPRR
ncbi:MAG: hypothetical protein IKJ77_00755 [Firmicutes bacterium]|nr:hypothetical protein [Bacillota bacterium]